jgi:hypothetical protein
VSEPDPFTQPNDTPPEGVVDVVILDRCRELVAIKKEAAEIDARLAILKKRHGELQAQLLDAFADNHLQNLRIDGRTVYLHRQIWAGAPDKAAAHEALIAAGLGDYAERGFNTNKVSALYREWAANGETPPPELEGVITTGERYSIRVTR